MKSAQRVNISKNEKLCSDTTCTKKFTSSGYRMPTEGALVAGADGTRYRHADSVS